MNANDNVPPRRGPTPGEDTHSGRARVCPICGKPRDRRHEPFCSRRCADVDLHRWLKDGYVIPGAEGARGERGEEE